MSESSVGARITDSSDFTVGGGSAAALTGSMAASLAAMVARLSVSGEFGLSRMRCRDLADEGDSLAQELLRGAEADAAAYGLLATAYQHRQTGQESSRQREVAIEEAAVVASSVPRDNALRSRRVLALCDQLDGKSNPNAGSDLAVARLLATAALSGCVANVLVNLPLIGDITLADELRREAAGLRAVASAEAEVR